MVNASTPWTVRTTKRKSPSSVPNARKRPKTVDNVEERPSSSRRKSRQQTLTQIQFAPPRPQYNEDDELRPISTVPRRGPAHGGRVRLQKENSTLPQMNFVTGFVVHDDQEDDVTLLQDDGAAKADDHAVVQLDGARDTPNSRQRKSTPLMGRHTSKRKATPVVLEDSQEFMPTQKKRKSDSGGAQGDGEQGRRTSKRLASVNATRSIGLLSATTRQGHEESLGELDSPSARLRAKFSSTRSQQAPLEEPTHLASEPNNLPPPYHKIPGNTIPRTPSKKPSFIPSSQSPESLPPSTRRGTGLDRNDHLLALRRSPLKERSTNAQLSRQRHGGQKAPLDRVQAQSPPKRKICVLKLPTSRMWQEDPSIENRKTASTHSIWSPPSSSPRLEGGKTAPDRPVLEIKDSTAESSPEELEEEPLRALPAEIQCDVPEDEPEIPATSQSEHQLLCGSDPNVDKMQKTLPSLEGLLDFRDMPDPGIALQDIDEHNRPEHSAKMKDSALGGNGSQACRTQDQVLDREEPPPVRQPGVTCVDDSEEEGSILALSPGSSIANDTQFNAELANRIPTSSADISPSRSRTPTRCRSLSLSLQLDRDIELSLPRPILVHQQSTYSTTKTVPLNDTSSSPSLPAARPTERTVYPASLPRPSQISTQDPTQQYLPMSSMPLQCSSSPLNSGPRTITIKDSSSVPRPLHEIPSQHRGRSQSPSQSQLDVDLGLDDCLDSEDEDDLDEGLAAASNHRTHSVDDERESQVTLPPPANLQAESPANPHTKTTEARSPVTTTGSRRRPPKPVIPPEVRALLGESLLESVPGPPGWSQGSWDDEPL